MHGAPAIAGSGTHGSRAGPRAKTASLHGAQVSRAVDAPVPASCCWRAWRRECEWAMQLPMPIPPMWSPCQEQQLQRLGQQQDGVCGALLVHAWTMADWREPQPRQGGGGGSGSGGRGDCSDGITNASWQHGHGRDEERHDARPALGAIAAGLFAIPAAQREQQLWCAPGALRLTRWGKGATVP